MTNSTTDTGRERSDPGTDHRRRLEVFVGTWRLEGRQYEGAESGREWILATDWSGPNDAKRGVRCIQTFENGGTTRAAKWESSLDGAVWETFWDVTSTKKGFDRGEPIAS